MFYAIYVLEIMFEPENMLVLFKNSLGGYLFGIVGLPVADKILKKYVERTANDEIIDKETKEPMIDFFGSQQM